MHEAVKAIALVHCVTPVYEANGVTDQAEAEQHYEDTCRVYQAASPDEVHNGSFSILDIAVHKHSNRRMLVFASVQI